jgi:hypothetical protein
MLGFRVIFTIEWKQAGLSHDRDAKFPITAAGGCESEREERTGLYSADLVYKMKHS